MPDDGIVMTQRDARLARLLRPAKRLANPRWFAAYAKARRQARLRRSAFSDKSSVVFSVEHFPSHLRSADQAVVEVTRTAQYTPEAAPGWIPSPVADDQTDWDSRKGLLEILAALVEITSPRVVLEVGVERGYSSAVILAGMSAGGGGDLHSIDLPRIREDEQEFLGQVIPEELRDRWHLTLGPSRTELPGVLKRAGALDLFLHDGDHAYESQLEDLRVVWPCLRPGGIVVVDDVWTPAILDFGREVDQEPLLVRRADAHDAVGLIRKPSDDSDGLDQAGTREALRSTASAA